MKKTNLIIFCLLAAFAFAMCAYAASGREMYENGVVSDEGIPHGDVRDGIVSDESKGNMLGDMKDEMDSLMPRTGDGVVTDSTNQTANEQGNDGSGVALAILVAVLVAIAVIVIIFVIMPKLK